MPDLLSLFQQSLLWQFATPLLFTFVLYWVLGSLLNRLKLQAQLTVNEWDDLAIQALRKPLRSAVLMLGMLWSIRALVEGVRVDLPYSHDALQSLVVLGCLAWFLFRIVIGSEKLLLEEKPGKPKKDATTVHALAKLVKAIILVIFSIMALQSMGYSMSGILAFGGISGLAVGFAAKDILGNLFGGLMLYLDRPFKVGDWIRSPDQEIEGTVEYIGWRLTRIRTFDQRPLYVPNGTFTNITVENPSRMLNRRISETFGLRYDDVGKVEVIIEDVKQMLRDHDELETEHRTLIVNLNKYAASSVDFFIYTFTKTTNWVAFHQIKQDVLLKVAAIVGEHGAEFAFPTTTVQLEGVELSQGIDHSSSSG